LDFRVCQFIKRFFCYIDNTCLSRLNARAYPSTSRIRDQLTSRGYSFWDSMIFDPTFRECSSRMTEMTEVVVQEGLWVKRRMPQCSFVQLRMHSRWELARLASAITFGCYGW